MPRNQPRKDKDPYTRLVHELKRDVLHLARAGHEYNCKTKYKHPDNCCWKDSFEGKQRWRAELTWIALGPLDQLVSYIDSRSEVTLKLAYQARGVIWTVIQALKRFNLYSSAKKKDDLLETLTSVIELLEASIKFLPIRLKEDSDGVLHGTDDSGFSPARGNKSTRGEEVLSGQ